MAHKAGCLFGLLVNAGPVEIKMTRFDFDPEIKFNRAVVSGGTCKPRTVTTTYGGIIQGTCFLDPAEAGHALIIAASTGGADLTAVKYVFDMNFAPGARTGYDCGACKLIPLRMTGVTDEGGMQEMEVAIHTQNGHTLSTTI